MSRERYTVIVTSNRNLATKRLSLSKSSIALAVVLSAFFLAVLSFVVIDYSQLLFKETRYKFVLQQNKRLKQEVRSYTERMKQINVDLEKIDTFSKKLKMITNIENEEERDLELTIGKPLIEEDKREPANLGLISKSTKVKGAPGFPLLKKSTHEYSFVNPQKHAELSLNFEKATVKATEVERDMTLLWEKIAAQSDLLKATPSITPSDGWLSSGFGYRKDPFSRRSTLHKGLDFAGPIGTPIYAPAEGVVSFSGYEGGYGKTISIDHGYGVVTRYGHNSKLLVKTGQKVKRWQKIAEIGNTGRSTGPHLHYEVRVNGVPVDPKNYILQ